MYSENEKQKIIDSLKLPPKENFLRLVNGQLQEEA